MLVMLPCIIAQCIVMDCLKLIIVQQAKIIYAYKNMKEKLYRINATV